MEKEDNDAAASLGISEERLDMLSEKAFRVLKKVQDGRVADVAIALHAAVPDMTLSESFFCGWKLAEFVADCKRNSALLPDQDEDIRLN